MHLALARAGEYNGQRFAVGRMLKSVVKRKREKKEEDDPDWTQDPGVQDDLKAMEEAGGMLEKDYELRSNGMLLCFGFVC